MKFISFLNEANKPSSSMQDFQNRLQSQLPLSHSAVTSLKFHQPNHLPFSFFYFLVLHVICVQCVHVFGCEHIPVMVHICAGIGTYVYMCLWRPETDTKCPLGLLSTLLTKSGALAEHKVHDFSQSGLPSEPLSLPFMYWDYRWLSWLPSFYVGALDPNPSPHAGMVGAVY